MTDEYTVKVFPNPSATEFSIQVNSNSNEPVTVSIMDGSGRVMQTKITTILKSAFVTVGADLIGGTYFARVSQGKNVQVVKLVKLN